MNLNITIRAESAQQNDLLEMLKRKSTEMANKLINFKIPINDKTIKIWVKQYNDNFYPKIEFDADQEELQYDMAPNGEIREAHFKSFITIGAKTKRVDMPKENASLTLQNIDNCIRFSSNDSPMLMQPNDSAKTD